MNKTKYEKELKKAFIAWFEEKADRIYDIGENSQKYLAKNLGIEEDSFIEKYINPITKLNNPNNESRAKCNGLAIGAH